MAKAQSYLDLGVGVAVDRGVGVTCKGVGVGVKCKGVGVEVGSE